MVYAFPEGWRDKVWATAVELFMVQSTGTRVTIKLSLVIVWAPLVQE